MVENIEDEIVSSVDANIVLEETVVRSEKRGRSEATEEEVDEVEEEHELVELRPKMSVPSAGGVETILNLNEWLKSPYQLVSEI